MSSSKLLGVMKQLGQRDRTSAHWARKGTEAIVGKRFSEYNVRITMWDKAATMHACSQTKVIT